VFRGLVFIAFLLRHSRDIPHAGEDRDAGLALG
jgi:hypothetical protein